MRFAAVPCLAVAVLALLPAAQDPRDPAKPTPSATERKSIEAKVASMQGLWRVRDLKTPKLDAARRLDAGFVLVSGLTFSIELHTGYVAPDGKNVINKDFQSGMHRFEIDDSGFMETKSVIGSFFNEQGLLQFEQPNKERRYEVKLGDNDMTWSNQDGTSRTCATIRFVRWIGPASSANRVRNAPRTRTGRLLGSSSPGTRE